MDLSEALANMLEAALDQVLQGEGCGDVFDNLAYMEEHLSTWNGGLNVPEEEGFVVPPSGIIVPEEETFVPPPSGIIVPIEEQCFGLGCDTSFYPINNLPTGAERAAKRQAEDRQRQAARKAENDEFWAKIRAMRQAEDRQRQAYRKSVNKALQAKRKAEDVDRQAQRQAEGNAGSAELNDARRT